MKKLKAKDPKKYKLGGAAAKSTKKTRKDKKTKIDAYKKLATQMESGDYDKKRSNKLKRTYKYLNKTAREQGRIAKDMIDIAGVIKKTGDPTLTKLGMLKTKYKTKDDARIAGRLSKKDPKTGKRKILDPYAKGGVVTKYKGGLMVKPKAAKRGY